MTAKQKIAFLVQILPNAVKSELSNGVPTLEIDFAKQNDWLSEEDEMWLRLYDATNIFAYSPAFGGESEEYTDELNTACCGVGVYIFNDDLPELVQSTIPIEFATI